MNDNFHNSLNPIGFKETILNITNELIYLNDRYNNLLENIDINSLIEAIINFNILFTYMKDDLIYVNNNATKFTETSYDRLHIAIHDELNYKLQLAISESKEIPHHLLNARYINTEALYDLSQYIADLLTECILRKFYNEIILKNILICDDHDFIYGEVFSIDIEARSKINNYNFYTIDYNKRIYEYFLNFKVNKLEDLYE